MSRLRSAAAVAGCGAGLALLRMLATADPAAADNCQDFTDCFSTADAASDALLGLTFLGMLSMALNFIPYVGTAKGVLEALTGRDLLTGQELSATDRMLGLIPGGLGRGSRLGRASQVVDDASGARPGARSGAAATAPRPGGALTAPPPARGGTGGPPSKPPGRPPPPPGAEPPRRPPAGSTPDRSGPWGDDRSRVQGWRESWWNDTRPTRTPNGEETVVPNRNPSVDHQPTGEPERVSPHASAQNRADVRHQNNNARVIAEHGFDIHQGPRGMSPQGYERTADYEINGRLFDHKVPHTDNAQNFVDNQLERSAASYQRKGTQANRFVVDLDHGHLSADALRAELARRPSSHIQEVLVIRNGDIVPLFP